MLKKIFIYVGRFILGSLIIYLYNFFITPGNIAIPLNLFVISIITLFGLPAAIGMCLFSLVIK